MTACLFIPAATGSMTRRVEFANFASLFADVEEPAAARGRGRHVVRLLAMLVMLVLAIGDTVLIARPDALAQAPGNPAAATAGPVRTL